MIRFYGTGAFYLPGWALEILVKCIHPLRSLEATWQANAVRAGNLYKVSDYEKQMRHWRNASQPTNEIDTAVPIHPKNEEWFKANGINYRLNDAENE